MNYTLENYALDKGGLRRNDRWMLRSRKPRPVPLAPSHRPRPRRWRLACSCGMPSWRRCPDRRATVPTTADERLPPYWATAVTDEYDQLARARVWRRNEGHW